MKKIIVPTDFSDAAKNAYEYATHLVDPLNAALKVVHVCYPDVVAMDAYMTSIDIETLKTLSTSRLRQFVHTNHLSKEGVMVEQENENLEQEVVIGFANTELQKISKAKDTHMIIMGTTGASGLLSTMFGSVSSHVSQSASCPVWLVPPKAIFKGIRRIMYASSFDKSDAPMIERVINFSNSFGASIHLVHVKEGNEEDKMTMFDFDKIFEKIVPANEVFVNTIKGDTVWQGLQSYSEEQAIDLIVIGSQQRSFWEKLLYKQHAKSIITHTKVPILVMHF